MGSFGRLTFALFCLLGLLVVHPVTVRAEDDVDTEEYDEEEIEEEEEFEGEEGFEEEDYEYFDEEEEDAPIGAHEDVTSNVLFTRFSDKHFPSGSKVETLIGITNHGKSNFNVTILTAALVAPQDYDYHHQNFSTGVIQQALNAGESITIEYSFTPSHNFDPQDIGLKLLAYYEDEENEYLATIHNSTIFIVEPEDFTDPTTFFTYTGIIGGALLVGLIGYKFSSSSGRKARRMETGTKNNELNDVDRSFLEGNPFINGKAKSGGKKRKNGGKNTKR